MARTRLGFTGVQAAYGAFGDKGEAPPPASHYPGWQAVMIHHSMHLIAWLVFR